METQEEHGTIRGCEGRFCRGSPLFLMPAASLLWNGLRNDKSQALNPSFITLGKFNFIYKGGRLLSIHAKADGLVAEHLAQESY